MGIFSRFSDIINSNLNSILEKAEDPEKIVRLMIQEMEDTLVEVRSAAARAIADKKEISRKLELIERDAADWKGKAELAIDKGRDDLAKAALAPQCLGRLHDYKIDDALVRFEQFERRMDTIEGHVESYDLGGKKDLSQEIEDLEANETVERELSELKSKRSQQGAAD